MFYTPIGGGAFTNSLASTTAIEAESAARTATTKTEFMQHDIDRLLLITQAMWSLMKSQHGYTDETLSKLVGDIEQKRASTNGVPIKDPPVTCAGCGRPNTANRMFCIYCGKQMLGNPFAR